MYIHIIYYKKQFSIALQPEWLTVRTSMKHNIQVALEEKAKNEMNEWCTMKDTQWMIHNEKIVVEAT